MAQKALSYTTIHEPKDKYDVRHSETRYRIVDTDTGEILDDAQGYGYKTAQKAYAAWGYKNRDKTKDAEKEEKKQHIRHWLKQHKQFANAMEEFYFEIECKHSWGPDDRFDAKFVQEMLDENNLHPDFSAGELLKVWLRL